jgi:hypothetical protein
MVPSKHMGEIALLGDTSTKCSVVKAILKYYWRVLNVILNKSPLSIMYFSSTVRFQLNSGEKGKYNISSKNHLES